MEINHTIDGRKLIINFNFTPEEVRKKQREVYKDISKSLKINGFRKGKVPYRIAENILGKDFLLKDVAMELLNDNGENYIKENNFNIYSGIHIKDVISTPDGLTVKVYAELKPEIDLKKYLSSIKEEEVETDTIDEDVETIDKKIEEILNELAEKTEVDRGVEEGDYIDVEFLNHTKNRSYPLHYSFVTGTDDIYFPLKFHERFYSKRPGEEVVMPLNHEPVRVRIKAVYSFDKPEYTDEFIKENLPFETREEFEEYVVNALIKQVVKQQDDRDSAVLLDKVLEKADIHLPNFVIEDEMIEINEHLQKKYGSSYRHATKEEAEYLAKLYTVADPTYELVPKFIVNNSQLSAYLAQLDLIYDMTTKGTEEKLNNSEVVGITYIIYRTELFLRKFLPVLYVGIKAQEIEYDE